jgi:hypothetical protein
MKSHPPTHPRARGVIFLDPIHKTPHYIMPAPFSETSLKE